MKFDRSKFKKTDLSQIKETVESAEKTMYQRNKGFAQFAPIQEGKNVFRVLPSGDGLSAYAALKVSKLQVEVDVYDDKGNITGKEVKAKNVFCADVHGKGLLKGKDPIVTYCNYVFKKAEEEYQDSREKEKFLAPVTGYRNKKGEFIWGINPTLSYICYVLTDDNHIARLQLRSQWMKRIQEISVEMSEDDTVSLDVFSGPDDGYPLCISMVRNDKKKFDYSVSAGLPSRNQSWDEFFEENAVSDETLQSLEELPSLTELYVESYKKKDFEMALDGLERLDKSVGYDIFQNEEFLNEIEEMAAMIPEEDDEPKEDVKETKPAATKRPATQTAPAPSVKRPAAAAAAEQAKKYPPLIKMKVELKEYIEREYEGEEELPDLSIVELRNWYDLMKADKLLPFEDYKEDPDALPFSDDESDGGAAASEENEEEPAGDDNTPSPIDESATSSVAEAARAKVRNLRERFGKK